MGTTFALVADLWQHVGPGILFAFALPVLVVLLGLILFSGFQRVRGE